LSGILAAGKGRAGSGLRDWSHWREGSDSPMARRLLDLAVTLIVERGVEGREAAAARAAVPARGGGDDVTCAGPVLDTPRSLKRNIHDTPPQSESSLVAVSRMPSPVEKVDAPAAQPSPRDDVRRLNAVLGSGFSFRLRRVSAAGNRSGRGSRERRGGRTAPVQVTGVLTVATSGSTHESAPFPVCTEGRRRERLLALARCLAECAMDLGMGAAIYKKGRVCSGDLRWAVDGARPHP